jgi:hypothetical protein
MSGDWRTERRRQLAGAAVAAAWLVVVIALDRATPRPTLVLTDLFALSPLIACMTLPALPTAGFAVVSFAFAVASGSWNHTWGTTQQWIRLVDVLLICAAAVVVSAVRVRREGRLARMAMIAEVAQRTILPTLPGTVGQVALATRYVSAAEDTVVGGDLYDCYHSSTHVRFLVGDVRGKGIGAVEQAARVIRAFRQSAAIRETLPDVAREMSDYLIPFFDDEEFVTCLLVDGTRPGELTVVSGGHPPALLVRPDGRGELVEAPAGLPLGMFADRYSARTLPWHPGDRLLMYTDGLSEARDAEGEFLDVAGLAPLLTAGSVEEALDGILAALRRHVPGGRLTDDLAVVLLENLAVGEPVPTAAADAGSSAR